MIRITDLVPMIIAQRFLSQSLQRTPERPIMDGTTNVAEYDEVLDSKLAIVYAGALEWIHRVRSEKGTAKAVDLACGPGHFSIFLSQYLGYEVVTGVDLSPPMIEMAKVNANANNIGGKVSFELGDAMALSHFEDNSCDLTTFNDAAHHMPDLVTVSKVLSEMERITVPTGLIFVMDLVRLKNASVTKRYLKTIGSDYLARGLTSFYQDFENSMYAAWTVEELRSAIPCTSRRDWFHLIPWGLPTIQMLVALPVGQTSLLSRSGVPWRKGQTPVRQHLTGEWRLFRTALKRGTRQLVHDGDRVSSSSHARED